MHGALIALDEREVSVIILIQGALTIQVAFSGSSTHHSFHYVKVIYS